MDLVPSFLVYGLLGVLKHLAGVFGLLGVSRSLFLLDLVPLYLKSEQPLFQKYSQNLSCLSSAWLLMMLLEWRCLIVSSAWDGQSVSVTPGKIFITQITTQPEKHSGLHTPLTHFASNVSKVTSLCGHSVTVQRRWYIGNSKVWRTHGPTYIWHG